MKKVLAIMFVLVMVIGVFAGCGNNEDANTVSDASSVNSSGDGATDGVTISTDDISLKDEDGGAKYRVVRPENDEHANKISAQLFKAIREKIGLNCKNILDTAEDGTDQYEILIGKTNRPESSQALEYMVETTGGRYDDYVIVTIGKKIVINAYSDAALTLANEYFVNNYLNEDGVITGGINYTFAVQGDFKQTTILGNSLVNYCFIRPYFNSSYLTQLEMEAVRDKVYADTGYMLNIKDDDKTAAGDYEIIVGNSSRDGVSAISDVDAYSIKTEGNKVYINGGSPYATALAVTEFGKMLESGNVAELDITKSYTDTIAGYDKSKYFYPTWVDDFNYVDGGINGIDTSKWHVMKPGEDDAKGHNGRTSVRSDRPDVTYVKDGKFYISATYDDKYYYGAKLVTKNNMVYRYGYIEMSALLPHGDAFWISLWMNSKLWDEGVAYFTEINVAEMFGHTSYVAANCHGWKIASRGNLYDTLWAPAGYPEHWSLDEKYSSKKKYYCPDGYFKDGFHTFGYYWTEDECTFVCDGNVYFTLDLNEDPVYKNTLTQPLYLILSEAVCFATGSGKNMADDAAEWKDSNDFIVDYIHIYQKDDGKHELRLLK